MFDVIQDAIVLRNYFGNYSVCGDDLSFAAAIAILRYADADEATRARMIKAAEAYREEAEACGALPGEDDV